jgi:hypothetical protein
MPTNYRRLGAINPSANTQTNVYVVGCSKTNQACVIDAPVDCLPFVNTCIKKYNLHMKY